MNKFIKYLGKCALNGKMIAVYGENGNFRLRAETTGSKPVRFSFIDEQGKKHSTTVQDLVLSETEFEAFEEKVSGNSNDGAGVVMNSLIEMGYPESYFSRKSTTTY